MHVFLFFFFPTLFPPVSLTRTSVSSHSLYSQAPLPSSSSSAPSRSPKDRTKANGALSIRSASPMPGCLLQSSPQCCPQPQKPPPFLSVSSTLMPDSSSGSDKKGFFRKLPTLGKRSAPTGKSPRVTTTDDGAVGETISRPLECSGQPSSLDSSTRSWPKVFLNKSPLFSYHARAMSVYTHSYVNTASYTHRRIVCSPNFWLRSFPSCAVQGIPPVWTATLVGLAYSEAVMALILKGRRNLQPCP
jgi:hypothetical protein